MGYSRLPEEVQTGDQNAPTRHRRAARKTPPIESRLEVINGVEFYRGSGNIFADFGDPDAERQLIKSRLTAAIIGALDEQKLTLRQGAKITGIDPADIQRIRHADVTRFSIDRLLLVALRLGVRAELKLDGK
jgi:predicted XRE-type DNA-binding protein